jgi:hypothetical protein
MLFGVKRTVLSLRLSVRQTGKERHVDPVQVPRAE